MEEKEKQENSKDEFFYEEVIKKTKTGITIPKELRDLLFENDDNEVFFHLAVPNTKDKLILRILNEEEVVILNSKVKRTKDEEEKKTSKTKSSKKKSTEKNEPKWAEYFMYEFEAKEKVKPILESAFEKFAEEPINFDDAMGRVKYALISYLSSTKTENAKLYFSVLKFLVDIIENFNQPNLIDWLYEKVVPNIESQFLYELSLLELIEISIKFKRLEIVKTFIHDILTNIDSYTKSEMYNIMNSFSQLVKRVKSLDAPKLVGDEIKEKL
ncbi:MAG: hypothetical protein EU549_05255, partial [Promethearchaeota archaeon]